MADDYIVLDGAGVPRIKAAKDLDGKHHDKPMLVDETGAFALGQVTANPAANTMLGRLKAIADGVTTLAGHVDGLEPLATTLNGLVDGLETLVGTTNTSLTTLHGYVDGLEALHAALNGYVDGLEGLQGTTNTTLTSIAGYVDGLEALATTLNTCVDGLEAAATSQTTAIQSVGTRAYGAGQQVAVATGSAATSGLAATEVLLHASTRCFVRVAATATAAAGIPLEAGEKFHLRLNSGQQVHVIRDTSDGFLNVVPVA